MSRPIEEIAEAWRVVLHGDYETAEGAMASEAVVDEALQELAALRAAAEEREQEPRGEEPSFLEIVEEMHPEEMAEAHAQVASEAQAARIAALEAELAKAVRLLREAAEERDAPGDLDHLGDDECRKELEAVAEALGDDALREDEDGVELTLSECVQNVITERDEARAQLAAVQEENARLQAQRDYYANALTLPSGRLYALPNADPVRVIEPVKVGDLFAQLAAKDAEIGRLDNRGVRLADAIALVAERRIHATDRYCWCSEPFPDDSKHLQSCDRIWAAYAAVMRPAALSPPPAQAEAPDAGRVDYWDCDKDAERLRHKTADDAIEDLLDEYEPGTEPETVTVYAYRLMRPKLAPGRLLEVALEDLDEEYGDPEGNCSDMTEAMRAAEAEFRAVIEREYDPWACERATELDVTVDVREWLARRALGVEPEPREHQPQQED